MAKIIKALILTADKFEDMELFFPYFRLLEEGIEVDVAAPKKGHIEGEHGYGLEIDKTFDEVRPDDYDLLLIPGGSPNGAPAVVRKDLRAQAIAKSFFNSNKPVSSICHGPWLLASAGVVKGRHLTSFWHDGVPEDIKKAAAYTRTKK
jgi:protease I